MKHYFAWKATSFPSDKKEDIQDFIEKEVCRCIEAHQTLPPLRIEVRDGPLSLDGEATTDDGKTLARFTYSLNGAGSSFQYLGHGQAK
ncbi:MAG: hypothetical protein LLG15_02615 [Betaproteobacteria bacterium]|nr:hypothetical protein [Betaproteobacteria bacterium]